MALEASEVAVRVRLVGGSAFQTEATKVAASTEEIGAAGKKANQTAAETGLTLGAAGTKLTSVGNKMIGFGRTLTMVGVPLAAAGAYAMKTASSFGQQMTLLSTQAGEQAKNIGWMSNSVLSMAKNFGALPTAMATGLYNFESVGIHGKAALNDIKAAAMGSAVGLDSLANTTDAVSSIMTSKIKGSGGPVQAMAIMDKAIGVGKMHLSDLTDSFKSGIIPMSQQFGITFQQILAAEAALTRVGIPASQVTARMRLMYTSMVAPSTGGAAALSKIGISPTDLATTLQGPSGLPGALEELKSKLSLLPGPLQDQILAAVFGRSRGMGQITSMLTQLPNMENIYGQVMTASPATLQGHFQQTSKTSAFRYAQLHAQLDAALIKLGTTLNRDLLPVLVRIIPYFTKMIDGFSHLPKPLQDVAMGLAAFVIVGGPLFMFTGALFKGAGMLMQGIELMIGPSAMGALRAGVAMTAGEMMTGLIPAMVLAAGYFALFHTKTGKKVVHGIEGAGADVGRWIGENILGIPSIQGYLHSKTFQGYNPVIKSDIEGLMSPNSYIDNHLERAVGDFQQFGKGINIDKIPGISQSVKDAIKEGLRETPVNVLLPNGRVLAQTVNDVNRKNQNRR